MNGTCISTIFWGPTPPGALGRVQRSNIIKSQLLSQFQIFLNQTLYVFSQMKDINILNGIFVRSPGSCPRIWDLGELGVKKFYFLNIVMWHIKLKGMNSSPGYTKFYPTIKLVTLGWGQRVNYH